MEMKAGIEREISIGYMDKRYVIGSVKETSLTSIEHKNTIIYRKYVELVPANFEIGNLIKALSSLKMFSDNFRLEVRQYDVYAVVENKDVYESIKYELLFTSILHNNANTDFNTEYNIEHFLSVMKKLNPENTIIDFEAGKPLLIWDDNNVFILVL